MLILGCKKTIFLVIKNLNLNWLLLAYFLAPSPHLAAADVGGVSTVMLPSAVAVFLWPFVPFIFASSFPSWVFWFWRFVFMIPFLIVFIPIQEFLQSKLSLSFRNARAILLVLIWLYWMALNLIWGSAVPLWIKRLMFNDFGIRY